MNKSREAFVISAKRLRGRYYWTITSAELLSVKETRARWHHLQTLLIRKWPDLCGLRVFELHEDHGLHVHLVTNTWMDVDAVRSMAIASGWGRIHVEVKNRSFARYLAKSLSAQRPECLRGWKLWGKFGKWECTRTSDLERFGLFTTTYRALKEWLEWTGRGDFGARMSLVRRFVIATVNNGWTDGKGPDGRPYSEFDVCDPDCELMAALPTLVPTDDSIST